MQLDLSVTDRDLLERIVEQALSEMRVEVRRTSTPQFHDDLAKDEQRLKDLLARIRDLASGGG